MPLPSIAEPLPAAPAQTHGSISVELRGLEPLTLCMPCRCATSCATAPGRPVLSPVGGAGNWGMLANRSVGDEIGPVPRTGRRLVVRREAQDAAPRVLGQHGV